MTHVVLDKISKNFGDVEVLKDVSFKVEPGEFLVVVGASGCGKSTLLRVIAGLETVSSGRVEIAGKNVTHIPPKDRDIAMVFQNYALYPHMTVYENMAYGLRNRKFPKNEINERVHEVAEILHLKELLSRKPNQLSGGQRQRVAMGRAIVRRPQVFLFDEPLSNLDAQLRTKMRIEIKKLQKRLGVTSIYVTHDQIEAMTLGDRLAIFHEGKMEQMGSPLDVYSKPMTQYAAGFIGSPPMNFIDGVVASCGTKMILGDDLSIPLPPLHPIEPEHRITIGFRPESVSLQPTVDNQDGVMLNSFGVELVELLGSETLVYGRFKGFPRSHVIKLPAGQPFAIHLRELSFFLPWGAIHYFDSSTGFRVLT